MKKLLYVFSAILITVSLCLTLDSCGKKHKGGGGGGGDDDDSPAQVDSDSVRKERPTRPVSDTTMTERAEYDEFEDYDDYAVAEKAGPAYEDKNAEIERWLSFVTKRYLNEYDIEGVPTDDLVLIRNLIFANHNYRFKESRFLHFFSKYEWYTPYI